MMFIATANTAGNPCGATGSRSPASPAPWRSRPAAKSGRATSRVAGLWRRAEADLGAAAAARRLDVEGRRAQVRGRRGGESGKRVRKRRRKESYSSHDGMDAAQNSLGLSDISEFRA